MSYLRYLFLFRIGLVMSNTYCVVFLFRIGLVMSNTYCVVFLFRIGLVMSNTYCVVFLLSFSSSCVPYVASFTGLSIFDCPFGII